MNQTTQVCYSCKKDLPFSAFNKKKTNPSGFQRICKECAKVERKRYYDTHKEKEFANHAEYEKNNRDTINKKRAENRSKSETYYLKAHNRRMERCSEDICYLVFYRYRKRIITALKNQKACRGFRDRILLGLNNSEYVSYLESTFTEGMTWDRYRNGEMQIDHIIPCACFDLQRASHQLLCFNYRNTRMLFTSENAGKTLNKWLSPEDIEKLVLEASR